jgi:protein DGCR14
MLENETGNDSDVTKSLDSWTYTTKNSLMYIPEGAALTSEEQMNKVKTVRVINHENTRFTPEALSTLYRIQSNKAAAEAESNKLPSQIPNVLAKIGIDGRDATPKESPKVRGYSFVEPSPSPVPGRMTGDESPMMFWGEIESTPVRLDPSMTPLPSMSGAPEFRMPDVPERERLALELDERASAERRRKKSEALKQVQRNFISPKASSNTPNTPYDRINSMSPAAQRLLSSKLSLKMTGLVKSTAAATPSPSSFKSTGSKADSPYLNFGASPVTRSQAAAASANQSLGNLRSTVKRSSDFLTDNLLKLPKNS